jgi:hypothetical protein
VRPDGLLLCPLASQNSKADPIGQVDRGERECLSLIVHQPAKDCPELGEKEPTTLSPRAIFFGIVFSLPLWGGIWYVIHALI